MSEKVICTCHRVASDMPDCPIHGHAHGHLAQPVGTDLHAPEPCKHEAAYGGAAGGGKTEAQTNAPVPWWDQMQAVEGEPELTKEDSDFIYHFAVSYMTPGYEWAGELPKDDAARLLDIYERFLEARGDDSPAPESSEEGDTHGHICTMPPHVAPGGAYACAGDCGRTWEITHNANLLQMRDEIRDMKRYYKEEPHKTGCALFGEPKVGMVRHESVRFEARADDQGEVRWCRQPE